MGQPEIDRALMRRCLDLAARAEGRTTPNPMVGAVVARSGRVIAEAWHHRAGGAHAEAAALKRAGTAARGATLYVNLEPCCHFGRTPPCVDAIVRAGIRRVVAAHRDPFPRVKGRGLAALRRAGIRVEAGLLQSEAARLNERYLTSVTRRRPFVLVKSAMSLDGRIATAEGRSRWITSPAARERAHRMRAAHDAVMVGASTVAMDDPRLTARPRGGSSRQPLRVVMDGRLRISPRARLLRAGGDVVIYTSRRAPRARARAFERAGAIVVALPAGRDGRLDLRAALRDLRARGVTSVLIEGGGELIASALAARVVDRVALFVAPILMGGRRAVPAVGGAGSRSPASAVRLVEVVTTRVGPDLLIEGSVARRRR